MTAVLQMHPLDWLDLFTHYLALSLMAIGGAISTAPDMHRYLVDQQHWMTDSQFNASITLANGMLIVSQSGRVHDEIKRLINLLRQFK